MVHPNTQSPLAFFCQKNSSLKAKIGLLTLTNLEYSKLTDYLLILLEYLQLISQAILVYPKSSLEDENQQNTYFFTVVTYFFKIVNPAYLLAYDKSDPALTYNVLLILASYMAVKYLLFFYVVLSTYFNTKQSQTLIFIWRIVFKLQARIICYFVCSFWLRLALTLYDGTYSIEHINKDILIGISCFLIVVEYFFSFFLETQFCNLLPNDKFLANKSLEPQLFTLFQKFLIQILQLAFHNHPLATIRLVGILNLVISIARDFRYFMTLPLYHFSTLNYQKILLALTTSVNYACFIQIILYAADYLEFADIRIIIGVWILLAILNIKFYIGLMDYIIMSLVTKSTENKPELLVHKIIITQHLRRNEYVPGTRSLKYDLAHLLKTNETINLVKVFALDPTLFKPKNLTLEDAKKANKLFVHYLENLSAKYPKEPLIQLNLAYFSTKEPKFYSKTLKAIANLEQSPWSKYFCSASLLLVYMEKLILNNSENFKSNLDLFTYTKSQVIVDKLKADIFKQIDLKISICENMLREKCDIGEIFDAAQIIGKSVDATDKYINNMLHQTLPDYYIQPFLLIAEYNLILNYSSKDCKKHYTTYLKKYSKYQKYFINANLIKENLYQSKNAYLLISAEKIDNGHIVYCSRSIEDICGEKRLHYSGRHISSLFIPSLQSFFGSSLKKIFEMGEKSIMNRVIKAYLRHKDGHLVEADLYMEVHPYISEKLYVSMIIHPVAPIEEYMIVNDSGDIEGATKQIYKTLCFKEFCLANQQSGLLKVQALSEELGKVNEAYNMVQKLRLNEKAQKNSVVTKDFLEEDDGQIVQNHHYSSSLDLESNAFPTSLNKVQRRSLLDLYTQFSNEGKTIPLKSLKQAKQRKTRKGSMFYLSGVNHFYHCEVATFSYRLTALKQFKLKKLTDDEEEEYQQENYQQNLRSIQDHMKLLDIAKEDEVEEEEEEEPSPELSNNTEEENSENIDCVEMQTNEVLKTQWRFDTVPMTHPTQENLLSPRSNRGLLSPISARIEVPPSPQKKAFSISVLMPSVDRTTPQRPDKRSTKKNQLDIGYQQSSRSTSTSSSGDSNKIFKKAILTKSHPLTFKLFYKFFYFIILLTSCSQVLLKVYSDDTMKDLVFKKDMLGNVQFRAFWMSKIQIVTRGLLLQWTGYIDDNTTQISDPGGNYTKYLLNTYDSRLNEANKQIVSGAYALDNIQREKIFSKAVRSIGSFINADNQTTVNITSFQLVDQICNAIRRYVLMDVSSRESFVPVTFMTFNTLDDFQVQNQQISQFLIDSIQDQKADFQIIRILCLVITPIMLAATVLTLAGIILRQYRLEKDCLLAFIKLDRKVVKELLDSFKNFRKRLENGECFEHKQTIHDLLRYHIPLVNNQAATYNKNQSEQIIKYSKVKKRYSGYIINVFCYSFVLLGIMLWNYIYSTQATDRIYNLQNQIQYANHMSEKFTLLYCTFVETFVSNNTNNVTNLPPYDVMVQGLAEVRGIQSSIVKVFQKPNKDYYPEIYSILFEDGECSDISINSSKKYCESLARQGYGNLLTTIALFESSYSDRIEAFKSVNRSSQNSMINTAILNVNLLPASSVIAAKAQVLIEYLSIRISSKIQETFDRRSLIIIVFLVTFAVASVIFWWQILSRVGEINNNFKRVLQVFPVDFVLSSFLIKLFLKNNL